jgi:hypothetical protein
MLAFNITALAATAQKRDGGHASILSEANICFIRFLVRFGTICWRLSHHSHGFDQQHVQLLHFNLNHPISLFCRNGYLTGV